MLISINDLMTSKNHLFIYINKSSININLSFVDINMSLIDINKCTFLITLVSHTLNALTRQRQKGRTSEYLMHL